MLRLAAGAHLLTGSGPGELFIVRNVGNFVPPYDASMGYHGTAAAVGFAVLNLNVRDIIVFGHGHCGAVKAMYGDPNPEAPHINRWLDLGRDAVLPVQVTEEALRRTEQRSIVLQFERLLAYPTVAKRVEEGRIGLHGWHYVIEDGRVRVLDIGSGEFRPADAPPPDADTDHVVRQLQWPRRRAAR